MEIQSFQPHGPYLLGGYCMGGTIALEIATQLREEGEDVAMVALLDSHNWIKLPSPSLRARLVYNWQKAYFHLLNILTLKAEKRRQFVRGKFLELKRRRAVWYGSVLRRFGRGNNHLDQSETLADVWANNDRVAERYQPRTYPGRISQFVPYKNYSRLQNSDVGWEQIARDGVDVQYLPVYPAGMLMEPYVELLASEIIKRIGSRTDTA
jgi:thioesterase domain-containing protein